MSGTILALNAGSSSLKFGLFEQTASGTVSARIALGAARAEIDGSYQVRVVGSEDRQLVDQAWPGATIDDLLKHLLAWTASQPDFGRIVAVGHRVVHGGAAFGNPVIIDKRVLEQLRDLVPLAPLHQPACLRPVEIIRELQPDLTQIACFDTAFHRGISPPATRYALPRKYERDGIRRYGFHGLSFESVARQIASGEGANADGQRVIIAHLGSGASLCALDHLKSVDTTMGFSTLDGLVMGTRSGSIDPGILLYLMRQGGLSADQLEHLLYRESGLLGVSGISPDVEVLLASHAPSAREALDLFAFQVARQAAALAATLGGLDRFVFTGGIGENAVEVRAMIVDRLGLFGAKLDEKANAANRTRISSSDSAILVERRPTEEEQVIAGHTAATISAQSSLGRIASARS